MVQSFPTEILQQIPSLLCRVQSGIIMEENHNITTKTGTFPTDGLTQAFKIGAIPVGVNCVSCSRKSISNTTDESQKTVASMVSRYTVSTKALRGFEKLWRANKLS
jgi:hypothetical protein